jgi:plastocyanin
MRKFVLTVTVAVAHLSVLAATSYSATLSVQMRDDFFSPQTITINVGDTVTWINLGALPHTTTSGSDCSPDGKWDSSTLGVRGSFSHTFTQSGIFPYFSTPDCMAGMVGTVTVNAVTVDIKANGSDSLVSLSSQDTLNITVALDNNGRTDDADWWVAVDTQFGLYFFTFSGWTTTAQPAYQGPLFHLPSFTVLNMPASALPLGTYTFFFGVDTVRDGKITLGNAFYDSVEVRVGNLK